MLTDAGIVKLDSFRQVSGRFKVSAVRIVSVALSNFTGKARNHAHYWTDIVCADAESVYPALDKCEFGSGGGWAVGFGGWGHARDPYGVSRPVGWVSVVDSWEGQRGANCQRNDQIEAGGAGFSAG